MKKLWIAIFILSLNGWAEETNTTAAPVEPQPQSDAGIEEVVAAPTADAGTLIGSIDLRPSWQSKVGEFHTENNVLLGYQVDKNTNFAYRQYFNTNIYTPGAIDPGVNAIAKDGYFRFEFNNLWQDTNNGLDLGYTARAYTPTDALKRDAGMVTTLRNYITLTKRFDENLSAYIAIVPILHVYDQAGSTVKGITAANPIFENRVYLGTDVTLAPKLVFSFPLAYSATRYRNFAANAKNNDAWANGLWIEPELMYAVTDNYTLGLAYYSDIISLNSGFGTSTIAQGLENGITQLVFKASL